jgi:hypothetical protein
VGEGKELPISGAISSCNLGNPEFSYSLGSLEELPIKTIFVVRLRKENLWLADHEFG